MERAARVAVPRTKRRSSTPRVKRRTAAISRKPDVIRFVTLLGGILLMGFMLGRLEPRNLALVGPPPAASDVPIYVGGLSAGWQDWSWMKHELVSKDIARNGQPAVKLEPDGFQGLYFHTDALDTTGSTALWVWVHGGKTGGQKINICAVDASRKFLPAIDLGKLTSAGNIPAGRWSLAIISLNQLKARNTQITGFVFQDATGKKQSPVYLADIVVKGGPPKPEAPITIEIDASRDVKPISPLIYGLAGGKTEMLKDLRIGSLRWGGNPNTRYNWERGNTWNAARDWEFRNGNYGNTKLEDRLASGVADQFAAKARSVGAAAVLTIPTIGYVSADDDQSTRSVGVPKSGGAPVSPGSEAISGYDPASNQKRTSVRSFPKKRSPFEYPPDPKDDAVYQDEWVAHLVQKFGKAADGGIRFYAMDNEPDLWASTHTDIHPVQVNYDELLSKFLEYATAIKAVDPTAQITGPVSWGWTGYFHSPRDQGNWDARPDRKAHGDMPLIPWFLDQVRKHDQKSGKRTLDVLDIHYYPQGNGVYGNKADPATNALRLRSTRGLWDPTYKDESWIGDTVNLIPRMRGWIGQYYPGTKLGITEWNWGADGTPAGGVAIAECLGIFGREGVFLANYWTEPGMLSPGYFAFKIYRNANGMGDGLGDQSVRAISSSTDEVSCFAATDSRTGAPSAIIINKQPDRTAAVNLVLKGSKPLSGVKAWRYDAANPKAIVPVDDPKIDVGTPAKCSLRVPPYSITLIRFDVK